MALQYFIRLAATKRPKIVVSAIQCVSSKSASAIDSTWLGIV